MGIASPDCVAEGASETGEADGEGEPAPAAAAEGAGDGDTA